ncbi:p53 and DNA damage-regulated protein 1-like [Amphiura filiformis]|uniref:p53 and DNA damage-regulated protein 1-like n=1 Tax=Amphiura filiformis TaxID=82378 RepID=UPI003B219354
MSTDTNFVLRHLGELEELAETVLSDKQQIVALDRKRTKGLEALRALSNKAWVCFGNTFIKMPQSKAQGLLKEDQKNLDEEIDKLRNDLKPKVSKLRDMEGSKEVKGFDLKALSKDELQAVKH